MRPTRPWYLLAFTALAPIGCSDSVSPISPVAASKVAPASPVLSRDANDDHETADDQNPHYNLNVPLRQKGRASGFLRFRQPDDGVKIVYLNVSVRHLAPNAHYRLQRATDTELNGVCTGTNWLTLGKGTTPADIVTDAKGRGDAMLYRDLTTVATGATFDIHFRVLDASSAIVLASRCYQYTVRGD